MPRYEMTGDEALAQGAWEAGVVVAAGYPGSPSTRFLEHLAEISDPSEVYAEWSANEKVAFEIALGASLAGRRASVSFKSVGLNVALDPLMVANLGGVTGGLVVVLGDDPGAHGSQNEQDGRLLVRGAQVPLLEYSSPQEAYELAKYAFSLSERVELPVFIRETRAASREKAVVFAEGERTAPAPASFASSYPKMFPVLGTEKTRGLHDKISRVRAEFSRSPYNQAVFKSNRGILAAGYLWSRVLKIAGGDKDLSLFKLGTLYPLPEEKLLDFLSRMEHVLVVEELQPYVEESVRALAQRKELRVRIYGKDKGHIPAAGEVLSEHVRKAIPAALGVEIPPAPPDPSESFPLSAVYESLPAQCPYYAAFEAFAAVLPKPPEERPVFVGDDGCLIRLMNRPFSVVDCKFCMGSAVGIATGLARAGLKRKVVALVGDSSFFHTGVPAYLNAAAAGARIKIVILDNRTTAMTGCQANPGTDLTIRGRVQSRISIESVLRSAGIARFRSVEAFGEKKALQEAFDECLEGDDLAVLLVTGPCPNLFGKIC
ncbi:MAG TPA: thiamine pyrophosphate-dependent enzyme [Thermodesulfobacteriota bacterium]|nr:thiamine pyrophosphate-dependent enzyme [Thermodesulfobacteriota bacterium]